jgi:hypothetical protein
MAHHQSAGLVHQPNTTDDQNYGDIKSHFCILDAFYRTASKAEADGRLVSVDGYALRLIRFDHHTG